jgi:hypothetical protein
MKPFGVRASCLRIVALNHAQISVLLERSGQSIQCLAIVNQLSLLLPLNIRFLFLKN